MSPKRIKAVRAWAIVDHNGYYELACVNNLVRLFQYEIEAKDWVRNSNMKVIEVLITPLPPKKRKRK